jgi:hypothetical protein
MQKAVPENSWIKIEKERICEKNILNEEESPSGKGYFSNKKNVGHPFVCVDYKSRKVLRFNKIGELIWEFEAPGPRNDIWILPNGNLLFNAGKKGVLEVNKNKEIVFEYNPGSEIHACQRLKNGNTFIGECDKGRLIEVNPSGDIVWQLKLLPDSVNGGHRFMRNARKLLNGNYLVCLFRDEIVREYSPEGKVIWEADAPGGPHSAVRLPNGNTTIACGDYLKKEAKIFEVNKKSQNIWEIKGNEVPEIDLKYVAGFQVLPNGNIVLANYLGHKNLGKAPHMYEITRDKKVVWTFSNEKNIQTICSLQLLDIKGDVTKGEIYH